jgi:hypothetical protein
MIKRSYYIRRLREGVYEYGFDETRGPKRSHVALGTETSYMGALQKTEELKALSSRPPSPWYENRDPYRSTL